MHRRSVPILAVLAVGFACRLAWTQTSSNEVRIFTEPEGLSFNVDGQSFTTAADFLWPAASKHAVTSYDQSTVQLGTRFVFKGATTNLSDTPIQNLPISANPALKWIKLTFDTQYRLILDLPDCPATVQSCPGGGTINGIDRRTEIYVGAGSSFHAIAIPNAGFIFTGWGTVWELGRPTQYDITFPMVGPLMLTAFFQPANAVHTEMSFQTDPPQLEVLLDQTPYRAPVTLEWGWGTHHTVGANPVQVGQGVTYVFDSWSDGGAINHDFQVPSQNGAVTLIAHFVPGTLVSILTSPPGLSVSIDGRQNWPNYNFAWVPGTVHTVSAPATQTDAKGHKYRFVSWSNGKTASFNYVAGPAPGNDHITAVYQAVGVAVMTSVPPGLAFQLDGANCITPCSIERDLGAEIAVSAPQTVDISESSRLVFQAWADGADRARTISLSPDAADYVATYRTENRLSVSANPTEGSAFVVFPTSVDNFYDSRAQVSITARPAIGFRIKTWSGSAYGTAPSIQLSLDSPRTALLLLDRVPTVAPMGVQNAASDLNPGVVAPGSLITIFGGSLAPAIVSGPAAPLAQTLGNVTVRVDESLLPLLFVSPGQINAQLSSGLSEGKHTLVVRWEGMPEASAEIIVSKNAPGLFSTRVLDRSLGLILRSSGEAISPENPAHPNEIISVLGTGLGPYLKTPPDGFLFDEVGGYILADRVSIHLSETTIDALYAGRSAAGVGIDAVQFRLPAAIPDSPFVPLKISINGHESNTVLLPVSF